MSTLLDVDGIKACLHEYLKKQSASVGEYVLIQLLSEAGYFTSLSCFSSSLQLFKKHFITMHSLYCLQKQIEPAGYFLKITPLEIQILPLMIQGSSRSQGVAHTQSPIAEYYLNINHLNDATEDSVAELLSSFWAKYEAWNAGDEVYQTLGLEPGSDWGQIQSAYRSKVQFNHPDKGGSTEAFVKVREAYLVLKQKFDR